MYFEMPSEALSLAVTTGLGVSVLAGVLSGICYILTQGLGRRRNQPALGPWHCSVCGDQFRSIQGILEVEKVATCAKCKQKICRVRCSRRDPLKGWICQVCQQPEAWFKIILNAIQPNKGSFFSNMNEQTLDELDEDLMELRKKEREQVRDFIERLVESLLGGTLDDVNIGRLYNDRKYLPITGQSPCTAHATLKHLIRRFSSEVAELPELKRIQDHPALPEEETTDRTYEDLLSTAIINKVVQGNQDVVRSNYSTASKSSRKSLCSRNKECFFSGETLDEKWRNHHVDDTSSVSSLDDWVRSDSSIGSAKYVDKISLTIKQRIDAGDLTCGEASDVESNHDHDSIDVEDSWSENWYLQKRMANSSSPIPVPMLVPNPIEEAKVYIGDKEASELSDIESDYGEGELVPDIKHILVNSRTIIGGKNVIKNMEDINEIKHQSATNGAKETSQTIVQTDESHREIAEDTVKVAQLASEETQDVSLLSIDSHTEKDTEYTEQYASLPRTIVKSPAPIPRTYKSRKGGSIRKQTIVNGYHKAQDDKNLDDDDFYKEQTNGMTGEEELNSFQGSYCKKEREKWKKAVDLPHNPYSAENLEKRLSTKSPGSTASSVFGRDYYIRQASKSTGSSKSSYALSTDGHSEESTRHDEDILVTAVPALVNPDEDMSESSATLTVAMPHTMDVSSDSDMSIERIYNPQTGTMIQNLRGVTQEFIVNGSVSPECISYVEKEFDADIRVPVDENRNRSVEAQKKEFFRSLTMESDESSSFIENISTISYTTNVDVPYTIPTSTFHENLSKFQNSSNQSEKQPENSLQVTSNLQKTLNKFDEITNEFSKDTKDITKDATTERTHEYKLIEEDQEIVLDQNVVEEFDCTLKAKTLNNYEIPAKYFGDTKNMVENKIVIKTSDYSEEDCSENKEFSLEYSTDVTDDISRSESSLEADPEILDLKEKKLVKDIIGKYTKSFPNVATIPQKKREDVQVKKQLPSDELVNGSEESIQNGTYHLQEHIDEGVAEEVMNGDESNEDHIPSVQNLKKIFDRHKMFDDVKKETNQIYSLTARSLPKSIREKLQNDEDLQVKTVLIEEVPVTDEECEEKLPADITKNRIKFFEELERKKY